MPLYDYVPSAGHCAKCKGRFEVFQRIADKKLTHCPACHKPYTGAPKFCVECGHKLAQAA